MHGTAFSEFRERFPLPFETADPLGPEALAFVAGLAGRFRPGLLALLAERKQRQARIDAGGSVGFLPETAAVREAGWTVAALPEVLLDRRVELIVPPGRRLLAAALASGAQVVVADFEDSLSPTLDNLVAGQRALQLACGGGLEGDATLMVRPRGLHLIEQHQLVAGEPVPACLFDAGLFLFHNAKALLARGAGPCLYLAKLEHHLEARWWEQVLTACEQGLGLPAGCIRTSLLIETLPAAFQMDELLHELRGRAAGLNLGRLDYLASFIRTFRADPTALLPDREEIAMEQPFLRACARLLVRTCHRRGCLALGGMSGYVPEAGAVEGQALALARVRADTVREIVDGCDGTWVASPGLVPVARAEFDALMPGRNQMHTLPAPAAAQDLLERPRGPRTEQGLRQNLRVGIRYLESWLQGDASLVLDGLLADAATLELARMQLWQWVNHGATVAGLGRLERPLFHCHVQDALERIQAEVGEDAFAEGRFMEAADVLETLILMRIPPPFLTAVAYGQLEQPALATLN